MKTIETDTTVDFVYTKDEIRKLFNDPNIISWQQAYDKLGFSQLFKKYYAEYGAKINIDKIQMPKTFYEEIYKTLQEHVLATKDKQYKTLRPKYKLAKLAWDMLAIAPAATEETESGLIFSYPKKTLD